MLARLFCLIFVFPFIVPSKFKEKTSENKIKPSAMTDFICWRKQIKQRQLKKCNAKDIKEKGSEINRGHAKTGTIFTFYS